jgi:hypothetical protein
VGLDKEEEMEEEQRLHEEFADLEEEVNCHMHV